MDPLLRKNWDQKKTLTQNFNNLGLALNLKPNLRHSKEGQRIVSAHNQSESKRKFKVAKQNMPEGSTLQYESESSDEEKIVKKPIVEDHVNKRDYNELFPGVFKNQADIVYGPSVAKLRGDDVNIMQRLTKKYKKDVAKMVKDINLNVMQWSKSEMTKKHTAYYAHGHDKQ